MENRRLPIVVALVLLTLCTQPLFAQWIRKEPGVCPPPASEPVDGNWVSTIVPLEQHERLLYSLTGVTARTLELRYRVDGALHLTEAIDLTKMELPQRPAVEAPGVPGAPGAPARLESVVERQKEERVAALPQRREQGEGSRVVELLTLQPDTMRELHRLDRGGALIQIDVLHDGSPRETITFAELTDRTEQLREALIVPVFAPSVVSGAGTVTNTRRLRVATNEYLENCWECTEAHPCETECGYDPGKGGPVTCGEYGAPCTPTCAAGPYTSGEWWTAWTYYSSGYGYSECFRVYTSGSFPYRLHNQLLTTYRRERIRRTTTCPNAPSCTGCYDTEAVIQVQYSQSECWQETGQTCFNGVTACCGRCSVYGWAVCGGISCY
jgi:hypothetical protein